MYGVPEGAKLALERRFGRPDGAKLALELMPRDPCRPWPCLRITVVGVLGST